MQAVNPVALTAQHVHAVLEGLPLVQRLQVALVTQLFFCHHLVRSLGLLDVGSRRQDRVHLGAETDNLPDGDARVLVLHLTYNLIVLLAVEEIALGIVAGVIETAVRLHVSVHVLRPDLEEQTVRVRV